MRVTAIPIVSGALGIILERIVKWLEDLETSRDHPDYSIIKIDQNTKSPGDFGRYAVIQTPVKGP